MTIQDSFFISNEISGSPINHTITYAESSTGIICDSIIVTIPSSDLGIYVSSLPSSCFHLSGPIEISRSASNRLGTGPTTSIMIGMYDIYSCNINP